MELLQLIYFCTAAETENFAKAALEHNVPPASISHSIKRLETELGISLFDRSPNGVQLNEQGKAFYMGAKASLNILEDCRKKVYEDATGGTIRLLVESGNNIVSTGVEAFLQKSPRTVFLIDHTPNEDWDKYDLIITDNAPFRKYYANRSILSDEVVLVMSADHPLAKQPTILLQDLQQQKLITTKSSTTLFSFTRRLCGERDFPLEIAMQTDDPYELIRYVRSGAGVAVLPYRSWEPLLSGTLCIRKIDDIPRYYSQMAIVVTYNTHKYMTGQTKSFLDLLMQLGKQLSV